MSYLRFRGRTGREAKMVVTLDGRATSEEATAFFGFCQGVLDGRSMHELSHYLEILEAMQDRVVRCVAPDLADQRLSQHVESLECILMGEPVEPIGRSVWQLVGHISESSSINIISGTWCEGVRTSLAPNPNGNKEQQTNC